MLENMRISIQGIWSHKMRSFLTMLGIIIGDITGNLYKLFLRIILCFFQHICTGCAVEFHEFIFLSRQSAGFVQYLFINGNFADIMQCGGVGDHRYFGLDIPVAVSNCAKPL